MTIIQSIRNVFKRNTANMNTMNSSEMDAQLTARECELSQKRNGSNDFILTPGLDNRLTTAIISNR